MKKILIIRMWADELNINGYNCQEIGIAKAFIRQGNMCDIVLYTKGNSREEDYIFDNNKKIHIYYLNAKNILKNCFYEKKLYKIILNYDIVQSAEYDQIANIKLYKILKNKFVIYHGPYESKYTKGYNLKCLFSDFIIRFNKNYRKVKCFAKSDLAKQFLNKKGFFDVTTIGVGLDFDRFHKDNDSNSKIENIEKDKENYKYLLYIGKIEKRRNVLFLLKILKECIKEDKNIKLIIVGNGKKNYKNKCMAYIKKNKLKNNIIYHEKMLQSELKKLYNICNIFLLPTNYEIFGMVLLESMYFKLPVITTLNGGSSTIIKNNQNGFICELDIEKWVSCILKNLNNNQLEDIKIESYKTVVEDYSWDKISNKYLENYIRR